MITLPAKWEVCGTSYLVRDLLRQADETGRYAEASRAMTEAALEYMMSGPRWAGRAGCLSRMPNAPAWRINDGVFYALARVDEGALMRVYELVRGSRCKVDLLVPPWAEDVMRSIVAKSRAGGGVEVNGIDAYVGLRVFWTRLEMGQRHSEALRDLLVRYDSLVKDAPALGIWRFHGSQDEACPGD